MARQTRRLVGGSIYRIWLIGQVGGILFRDPEDYTVYLKALTLAKQHTHLKLYHYSLLRHEVHLIVGVPTASALSSTLHDAHLVFHWHHRKKYQAKGRLFYDRFRHEAISEQDLLRIGCRVEQLPVRAGLVTHPADYPHSSYAHYALGQPDSFLDSNPRYVALAPAAFLRQEQYRRLQERAHEQRTARI